MSTDRKIKPPRRPNADKWKLPSICPGCEHESTFKERLVTSMQIVRNEEIKCEVNKWVCGNCGVSFMSPAQANIATKTAIATYQKKQGFLTGSQIREKRDMLNWSTAKLAQAAKIGEATVKRLEASSTVQQASTDMLLRYCFEKNLENHIWQTEDVNIGIFSYFLDDHLGSVPIELLTESFKAADVWSIDENKHEIETGSVVNSNKPVLAA